MYSYVCMYINLHTFVSKDPETRAQDVLKICLQNENFSCRVSHTNALTLRLFS